MANLLDQFKQRPTIREAVTKQIQKIDPKVDPEKGAIFNQLFANFLNKGSQAVSATVPQTKVAEQPQPITETPKSTLKPPPQDPFIGLNQVKPSGQISNTLIRASQDTGIPASLLAAMLWNESGYNPKARNGNPSVGIDRGIAQINSKWHPEVSDEQADDPNFAIMWMANELKKYMDQGRTLPEAIAAYNVGLGMTGKNDSRPTGLGPKGQAYVERVSRNLSPEYARLLGI